MGEVWLGLYDLIHKGLYKMAGKIKYCIGGGVDTWNLPDFNFISICSEKKT